MPEKKRMFCRCYCFFFLCLYFIKLHDTACLHLSEERTSRLSDDARHILPVGFLAHLDRQWTANNAVTSCRCTDFHNDGYNRGDAAEYFTRQRLQRKTGRESIYISARGMCVSWCKNKYPNIITHPLKFCLRLYALNTDHKQTLTCITQC